MENYMYEKLKSHIGHNVVCVSYGDFDSPIDVCIECEDCCEVLISSEDYEEEESTVNDAAIKHRVLDTISGYIEDVRNNFPRTRDDFVKIDVLDNLHHEIDDLFNECERGSEQTDVVDAVNDIGCTSFLMTAEEIKNILKE